MSDNQNGCSHNTVSEHDRQVLNTIFNPGLPYGDVVDDDAPPSSANGNAVPVELTAEIRQAKALELEGVQAAEANNLDAALEKFSAAIATAPNWASAYNNRAQALRLKGDVQGAMADVDKAIELSQGQGKAACQAYTQRALMRRLEGHEEEALEDFKAAARLGSEFAKQQVIALNPYAALCNQMLGEVIHKLRTGEAME